MFIAVEGIDGSGKSTLIKKLVSSLERDDREVVSGAGLGSGEYGWWAKKLIMSNTLTVGERMEVFSDALLHTLDDFVLPNLIENDIVILDRYVASFYAYQTTEDKDKAISIYNTKLKYIRKPDIYIHCNTDVNVCASRLKVKPDIDNMDYTYIDRAGVINQNYLNFFDNTDSKVLTFDGAKKNTKNYLSLVKSIFQIEAAN